MQHQSHQRDRAVSLAGPTVSPEGPGFKSAEGLDSDLAPCPQSRRLLATPHGARFGAVATMTRAIPFTPGPVYTMDAAAERLHKSRRWLQDWLRDHPVDSLGQPFYSPLGRTKTLAIIPN